MLNLFLSGFLFHFSFHFSFFLQVIASEEPQEDNDGAEVDVVGSLPETSAQVRVHLQCPYADPP